MKDQNQQSINLLIYRLVTKDLLTPFLITETIIGGNQWEILLNFKKTQGSAGFCHLSQMALIDE